ncbi:MAG: TA system VapC family ribonuclease toxin [Gammaproteobacteria bacterium]
MIAIDTNILVYAHRRDSEWHEAAASCVRELAEGAASWALPWPCLHEFFSVVTHERIYSPASPSTKALEQISVWLKSPSVVLISETAGYWDVLARLIEKSKISGPRVHDCRIAALCLHHGVRELLSADRDFSRFGDLKTRNPLTA